MARCNNWPAKLALFVEEKRNQPFVWGENDCALFTCDWIIILTGADCAAELRGRYRTALGASRLLRRFGGLERLIEGNAEEFGWKEIPVRAAQRGDIVIAFLPENRAAMPCAVGVVVGAKAVFAGTAGIVFVPLLQCARAWRVD